MMDTSKESNGNKATEGNLPEKQSKNRRHRRRSKPRHSRSSDTGTRDNNAADSAEDEDNPSSQASSGRMGKLALRNRQQTENQRMTITCLSPKMR